MAVGQGRGDVEQTLHKLQPLLVDIQVNLENKVPLVKVEININATIMVKQMTDSGNAVCHVNFFWDLFVNFPNSLKRKIPNIFHSFTEQFNCLLS